MPHPNRARIKYPDRFWVMHLFTTMDLFLATGQDLYKCIHPAESHTECHSVVERYPGTILTVKAFHVFQIDKVRFMDTEKGVGEQHLFHFHQRS